MNFDNKSTYSPCDVWNGLVRGLVSDLQGDGEHRVRLYVVSGHGVDAGRQWYWIDCERIRRQGQIHGWKYIVKLIMIHE